METTTKTKVISHSNVFDSSRMTLVLPITEEAMSDEMLNEYHSEVDGYIDAPSFLGAEANLKIEIYDDGAMFFSFHVERFYGDGGSDGIEIPLELSPEVASFYYKMAIKQFTDNLNNYKNI